MSDSLNWNGYWRIGQGTITSATEIINDSLKVAPHLGIIPTNPTRISNNQQVEWYSIRKTATEWRVDGKIVTHSEDTGAENALFYLLQKGVRRPTTTSPAPNSTFFCPVGYGTILPPSTSQTTLEPNSSNLVHVPDYSSYLSENDYVIWDTISNNNGAWSVIGEIYNNDTPIPKADTVTYYLLKEGVHPPPKMLPTLDGRIISVWAMEQFNTQILRYTVLLPLQTS